MAAGKVNIANEIKIQKKAVFLVILTLLTLASLFFHQDIFGYSFVGSDSPTLVENSRIQGFDDVVRIFSDGENAGTGPDIENPEGVYRPISILTYSLDYALWGLNPFGSHLTDFLLHLATLFLAAYLIFRLTRSYALTLLSGLIFTMHPIIIENLSASSRRQAILPVTFMLISLIFFTQYLNNSKGRKRNLAVSLAAYLLALGTHEIAILLPPLLLVYLVIYGPRQPWKTSVLVWVKTLAPYLVVTIVFLVWRTIVLYGMGGYGIRTYAGGSYDVPSTEITSAFLRDLLYPGDLFTWLLNPLSAGSRQVVFIILWAAVAAIAMVYYWRMFGSLDRKGKTERIILISLSVALFLMSMVLAVFSTMVIDESALLLNFLRGLMPIMVVLLLLLLVATNEREKLKNYYQASANGKVVLFAVIWTILPLLIFLPTFTYSHRSMYPSLVAFSFVVAILLMEALQNCKEVILRGRSSLSKYGLSDVLKVVSLLLLVVLALSFPVSTYLIYQTGEWKADSDFTALLFARITENINAFPEGSEVVFTNLPNGISRFEKEFAYAKQITYPEDYSIKSWMDLNRPGNDLTVRRPEWVALKDCPADLNLRIEQVGEKKFNVTIDYVDGSCDSN